MKTLTLSKDLNMYFQSNVISFTFLKRLIWATSWENLFMPYANNKGVDQPTYPRILISTFVVHCLDSIHVISLLAIAKISRHKLVYVVIRLVWVLTGRKSRRQVFSRCGSFKLEKMLFKASFELKLNNPLIFSTFSGSHSLNASEMSRLMTKTNKMNVRPAKTQISLGIRPFWSESSLCAQWVAKDPNFLHADSEDSDQTRWMPRLIWVFAGRTYHFVDFVMTWLKWKEIHEYINYLKIIIRTIW